jgi:IPT/TIG domain-containing protein
MRLRWTALLAFVTGTVLLGSCTSNTKPQPPPTPVITGLFPSSITAGSQMFTIFISGTGFITKPPSQVFWNGSMRTSVLNTTTGQLAVVILASDVASPGIAAVTVSNPEPGGPSLAATFTIDSVQNGTPLISSLSPMSASPKSGAFTLTVNGSNFVPAVVVNGVTQIAGSTVAWNTSPLPTAFVNANQLTASVPASNIASPGFASVSVYNTTPGDTQLFSPAVDFTFGASGAAFPRVASVSAIRGPADGASAAPASSADGRYVAFFSEAKNLVTQATHGNIFVRDTCIGATECFAKTSAVDLTPNGDAPDAAAGKRVAMSAEGRFVVFESKATNLVSGLQNGSQVASGRATNLYVRDLCAGAGAPSGCVQHTEALSVNVAGELASGGDSGFASVSGDGRFVAFVSSAANLVAKQAGLGFQIFVRDTCAGPTAAKACVPRTEAIPIDAEYLAGGSRTGSPAISEGGRYVVFSARKTNSVPEAGRELSQVLLYDTCLGSNVPAACVPSTIEISVSPAGESGNGKSEAPWLSGDGRFVVFQSTASNLVTEPSKSKTSVFMRDTCLGATASDGCTPTTTLFSSRNPGIATNADALAPWISASGRYVSFVAGISASAKRGSNVEKYLFARDTCFGATSPCAPHTIAVAAPANLSQATTLRVDQLFPVPIVSDGRMAAFLTTSPVATAPTSGYGDVVLTLTSF